VEAHAAAVMRNRGLTEATLYINNTPCDGPYGCDALLPHMLPPGATLSVHILGPTGWTTRQYTGISDSVWKWPWPR